MTELTGDDAEDRPDWRRRLLVGAGVVAGSLLAGALLGLLLAGGSDEPSRSEEVSTLVPLEAGALVAAPDASPGRLDEPRGLGSLHAGVAVVATSEVDEVRTADGRRRAPEGSRLLAFALDDWTCEDRPCGGWRDLDPQVRVDRETLPVPEGGDTFVVVVPPGTTVVDLVVEADGFTQSVSVLDTDDEGEEGGRDNIAVLSRPGLEERVPIGRTYRVAERTSVALDDGAGGLTDVFQREIGVEYAQLRFFLHGAVPSSPRRAFLVVNAYWSYAGGGARSVLGPGEVVFVDADGTRYEPRDLDPAPDKGLLGFEVPAGTRSGTLEVGGTNDKVSTTGVPYVSTLASLSVPISLDDEPTS